MKLNRLIDRVLGRAPVLEPRKVALFEPSPESPTLSVTSLLANTAREPAPRTDASFSPRGGEPSARTEATVSRATSARDGSTAAPDSPYGNLASSGWTTEEAPPQPKPASAAPPQPAEQPRVVLQIGPSLTAPEQRRQVEPASSHPSAEPLLLPPQRSERERTIEREVHHEREVVQPKTSPAPLPLPVAVGARSEPRAAAPAPLLTARREARQSHSRDEKASVAAPRIHVTIGRVEVRAHTPAAPHRSAAARRSEASISLQDYLQQRERRR
jgi:hypothetical protein